MSSSYYSKRLRYGSTSYNDGGYVSDGGYYANKSTSRLNKSRSVEDLTSFKPKVTSNSGVLSSRSFADVRTTPSADGYRFSSDRRPAVQSYRPTGYTREDRDEKIGRRFGSRESLIELERKNSLDRKSRRADSFRRGEIDGRTRVELAVGEVYGNSKKYPEEAPNKVKYRISGEIFRDTTSSDKLRGYYSDTGLEGRDRGDDLGYESEKLYGLHSNSSYGRFQGRREERPFGWRSRSTGRDKNEPSLEIERPRREGEYVGYNSRDRSRKDQGERDDEFDPAQRRRSISKGEMPNESLKPRSRSTSPVRRPTSGFLAQIGSPSRKMRKSSYVGPIGPGLNGDTDTAAVFPVCSRWPNCTVCSIDIPNSQINKDSIMRTMKAELKEEVENIALLEKKEKAIQEKSENNAQLTQELQRCQKELEAKNSEINRKDFEINQLRTEVKNLEISKKYTEQSYTEVQVQVNKLEVVEKKLADMQEEYDTVLLKNRELIDKIKYLEVAETDFIELERNVIELQEQLQDFENIEAHRDELLDKFQNLKRQRDEFLEKGRMVEEERNDFLRTNQTMEQRLEEFAKKYNALKKNCGELNRTILILEREKKDLESKMLEVQNDRNIVQNALGKLETERDDLVREVKEVTSEKYMLEQKLTEMDEMLSDHDHLEEGFHSLRLKLGEITRQRDDAEMLIPSLKAKIALLKKACREKDETMTRYMEELKEYRHGLIAMSPTKKGRIHENLQQQQQQTRNQSTSSYFTKNIKENTYTTKQNYDVSDESVVISEDDPSVIDEGSIDYRHNDRRLHTTNRTIRVYDRRAQPMKRRRIYRALTDYDPYKSSASHHPERELRLKEGDYVTVYGEMDIDGYLEAEIDGEAGLVPSIYVEESNDEYSTQRALGHSTRELVKRNKFGAYRRKFVCLYDYDPYRMGHGGGAEQQLNFRKGDVITVIGDIDIDGFYTAELNGRSGLVPSTFVRELGVSKVNDISSYGAFNQGREQKSYEQRSRIITENSNNSTARAGSIEILRDDVAGPPFPPTNLKVLRIVSNDSLILTWNMPPIDKSGCSNGALVTGYKIWVNGKPVQDVKKYLMTKALISGLNLRDHLEFDIQTVAENGFCSEKCHFDITGANSLRNPIYEEFFIKAAGNYRTFIALFDYDPYKSSPNQNPSLELQFNEGDLLKVYDTSRSDGFYHAEVRGKKGLVPSNFIEEISMPENSIARSEMYSTRSGSESYSRSMQNDRSYSQYSSQQHQKQQQQRLSTTESEKRSSLSSTFGGRRRKMVASYDYDPLKQSPSKDKSKELNLRKGQYVTVIGDMRPDGFYLGEIDGRQGFVPGDFLEPSKEDDMESRRVQFASANNSE